MRITGIDSLKKLGATLVTILLGAALLQKIIAEVPGADRGLLAALLLVSPAAYLVRESCRKKPARKPARRARERTRVPAGPGEED